MDARTDWLRLSVSRAVPVLLFLSISVAGCGGEEEVDLSEYDKNLDAYVEKLFLENNPDLSTKRRAVSLYLMNEGFRLVSMWDDSMHSVVDTIEDIDRRQEVWERFKDVKAPQLIGDGLALYRAALIVDSTNHQTWHLMSFPLNARGELKEAISC